MGSTTSRASGLSNAAMRTPLTASSSWLANAGTAATVASATSRAFSMAALTA